MAPSPKRDFAKDWFKPIELGFYKNPSSQGFTNRLKDLRSSPRLRLGLVPVVLIFLSSDPDQKNLVSVFSSKTSPPILPRDSFVRAVFQ